jgi:hypothetical protein
LIAAADVVAAWAESVVLDMMTPVVVVLTRFKQTKPRTIDVHRRSAALDRFDVNPAAAFTAMASSGHCARIGSSRELAGANASERNHCLDVVEAPDGGEGKAGDGQRLARPGTNESAIMQCDKSELRRIRALAALRGRAHPQPAPTDIALMRT